MTNMTTFGGFVRYWLCIWMVVGQLSSLHFWTACAMTKVNANSTQQQPDRRRQLQQNTSYYHVVTKFGEGKLNNYDVTLGNPHRGLASAPYIRNGNRSGILYSLEAFYYPLNSVVVGYRQYNWTDFEESLLKPIASRSFHAIPRFYVHYPGRTSALPNYLNGKVKMLYYNTMGGGLSPDYTNQALQDMLRDFIYAFGERYDGDPRISAIQAGLLGYWGEWHTFGGSSALDIPDSLRESVIRWYDEAFDVTPIMNRYPRKDANQDRNFGLHDDSFTYSTIDGSYAGGYNSTFGYFVPRLYREGLQDFWKKGPMGGEVRPENVAFVFQDGFKPSQFTQDFYHCSQLTHSTHNKVGGVFSKSSIETSEVNRANWNSARMGYAFQVKSASFLTSSIKPGAVDAHVVVENIGIAPIYFPTRLALSCNGAKHSVKGIEQLIEQFSTKTFYYIGLPATSQCLSNLTLTLESNFVYATRPIKFAQNNGNVFFSVPLPPSSPSTSLSRPSPIIPDEKAPTPALVVATAVQTTQSPTELRSAAPPVSSSSSSSPLTRQLEVVLWDAGMAQREIEAIPTNNDGTGATAVPTFSQASVGTELSVLVRSGSSSTSSVIGTRSTQAITTFDKIRFTWTNPQTGEVVTHIESGTYFLNGGSSTNASPSPYLSTVGRKTIKIEALSSSNNNAVVETRQVVFDITESPFLLYNSQYGKTIGVVNARTVIDLAKTGGADLGLRFEL